ncbi:V-type ATPase subunit [Candidatus Woesearchaeota archaeon]|nr:V-type ATPase subunit [Candidatus Woesearchaeota archaeon]
MRLSENPYVFVRTRVMKALLLKRHDYDKIMKMELGEISRFLSDSAYRREIEGLASNMSGVDLLENALNSNLLNTMAKLKRMSDESLEMLLGIYLKRWDFENVKILIRGISIDSDPQSIRALLNPIGSLGAKELEVLMKLKGAKDIIKKSGIVDSRFLKEMPTVTAEIENALDQYYYNDVLKFVAGLPSNGNLFRDFLSAEVEAKNVLTLIRLRRNNVEQAVIEKSLIKFDGNFVLPHSRKLLGAKTLGETFDILRKSQYSEIVDYSVKKLDETHSLIEFENLMKLHLLGKATLLSHQYPLSVDVILGYMFAKELEVSNLKTIIRGKQLGVEDEFLSRQLVVA